MGVDHLSGWAIHTSLRIARGLGRSFHAISDRYTPALREVFEPLPLAEARAIGGRMEANRFTRHTMRGLARLVGWSYLRSLVEIRGADALKARGARGALVVSWHWGLGAALLVALARVGETGHVLRYSNDLEEPEFASIVTGDELKTRAQAVEAAVRSLRAGGVVVLFQDVYAPEEALPTRPIPLWSRVVRLPAGPASLARLGRADVYVGHAFWRGGSPPIRVDIEPPIAPPETADAEWAWAEELWRHFERAILLDPGELWPVSLQFIERSPHRTAPDGL